MTEINNPAKQAEGFLDKFQHPFVGSFISSWIICNWDIFYTLLGGLKDPFDTVVKIKTLYPFADNYGHLIFLPLLGMAAYVFGGPFLLNWYLLYKYKLEVKRKFREKQADGKRPITQDEYSQLQADRMKDLRENEVLRALTFHFGGLSVQIPHDATRPAKALIEELLSLRDDKKRLENEILDMKTKSLNLPPPQKIEN